jgi:hypothetical protein
MCREFYQQVANDSDQLHPIWSVPNFAALTLVLVMAVLTA